MIPLSARSVAVILSVASMAPAIASSQALAAAGDYGGKHGRGHGYGERLKRMDSDKDGAITKDEFLQQRIRQFKELDANKDGAVDNAELESPMKERSEFRVKRMMKKLDANADSKVSRDEFQTGPRERFKARDIDGDGKMTEADMPPGRMSMGGWFSSGKSDAKGDGKPRFGKYRGGSSLADVDANTAAEFAKIDINADGVIDISELEKQAAERIDFSKKRTLHVTDTNNDGRLTEDEFTAKSIKRFTILDLNDDGRIASDDFPKSGQGKLFGK